MSVKTKTKPKPKRAKPAGQSRSANANGRRTDRETAKALDTCGAGTAASDQSTPGEALVLGKYIVADPKICHGKVTFRGTRVFVSDILEQVAAGMDWEEIGRQWSGSVSKEAIAEALHLSRLAFLSQFARERADLEDPP